jgi:hypothetical protein
MLNVDLPAISTYQFVQVELVILILLDKVQTRESEVVGYDPRAGLKFSFEFDLELIVGILEKIAGHHIGVRQIFAEKITIYDFDAITQSQNGDQRLTPQVAQGVDFNTHCPGTIAPGDGDDQSAIATAQVIDQVPWSDFGHGQHFMDHAHRCR